MNVVDMARKGGLASAKSLTAMERTERASKAARSRWTRYRIENGVKPKGRAKRKAAEETS